MIGFTHDALESLVADDDGGPVVMLNLLRFAADDGAAKYMAYAEQFAASGINEKYGLKVVYGGAGGGALVAEPGQAWDMVALVRYPSRRHFVDMVNDPKYQEFEHLRTDALIEAVLQPTTPLAIEGQR